MNVLASDYEFACLKTSQIKNVIQVISFVWPKPSLADINADSDCCINYMENSSGFCLSLQV